MMGNRTPRWKYCKNCLKFVNKKDFHKNMAKRDKLQEVCKLCNKEKVYAWRFEKIQKRWDKLYLTK